VFSTAYFSLGGVQMDQNFGFVFIEVFFPGVKPKTQGMKKRQGVRKEIF
jgi:hypothetical protein